MIRRYSFYVLILMATLALAASPAAFAQSRNGKSGAGSGAANGFGVTESLSGKIQMVVPGQELLVVNGPNNVPYDMKVTPKTLVVVNEKRGTIQSLVNQVGQPVTVAFKPQRDGDIATRVEVTD